LEPPLHQLHSASCTAPASGILTIARGTVPLAIFRAENYGDRLGLLGVPTRVTTAAAPLLFGMLLDKFGAGLLVFSSALSIAGLCSLGIGRGRG
jgi:hypothetical protein